MADKFRNFRNIDIEIGRELTAVKERLEHGQFLPWIESEFQMNKEMANNFMQVAARFGEEKSDFLTFKPSIIYALAAPSTPDAVVDRAIEKAESGEKVTVANVKTWKAEYEEEQRRSGEWREQCKKTRDKNRELELELDTLKNAVPTIVRVEPPDYQETKQQLAKLQAELQTIQGQQLELVQQQVVAKLRERQSEIDKLERKEQQLLERTSQLKAYINSIDNEKRRIETHQRVIEEQRLKLISLSAFLLDEPPMNDPETQRLWDSLASMLEEASKAIRLYRRTLEDFQSCKENFLTITSNGRSWWRAS